jgi:hypothetical protein
MSNNDKAIQSIDLKIQQLKEEIKYKDSIEVMPARFTYDELKGMNLHSLKLVEISPFYTVFDQVPSASELFKQAYRELLNDFIKLRSTKMALAIDINGDANEKE